MATGTLKTPPTKKIYYGGRDCGAKTAREMDHGFCVDAVTPYFLIIL